MEHERPTPRHKFQWNNAPPPSSSHRTNASCKISLDAPIGAQWNTESLFGYGPTVRPQRHGSHVPSRHVLRLLAANQAYQIAQNHRKCIWSRTGSDQVLYDSLMPSDANTPQIPGWGVKKSFACLPNCIRPTACSCHTSRPSSSHKA